MDGFRFGIDSDGNYGYYKVGADTVTPFKTGEYGSEYLRYNEETKCIEAINIQKNWEPIYVTDSLPISPWDGYILKDGSLLEHKLWDGTIQDKVLAYKGDTYGTLVIIQNTNYLAISSYISNPSYEVGGTNTGYIYLNNLNIYAGIFNKLNIKYKCYRALSSFSASLAIQKSDNTEIDSFSLVFDTESTISIDLSELDNITKLYLTMTAYGVRGYTNQFRTDLYIYDIWIS